MRAAVYRETGDVSVLSVEEIETPVPGPGQVRARVTWSGVNPTDWKSRSGATGRAPTGLQVPHHDGAGVIDAVGPGVDLAVGQRVWLYLAAAGNRYGTAAEYSVLPAGRAVPLPDGGSDELGASLGVPAVTAAHALGGDPAALAGKAVLVPGGAGAVGHYAIELAKHAGAWVVSTVSSGEKAALATAAGADRVVNYRQPGAAEAVREALGAGPAGTALADRIVEVALGANLEIDLAVAGPGTTIAVYASEDASPVVPVPTRPFMAANATISYLLLYTVPADEMAQAVGFVSAALAAGALTELPLQRFELDDVAAAQDAVQAGAVGKVLVRVGAQLHPLVAGRATPSCRPPRRRPPG